MEVRFTVKRRGFRMVPSPNNFGFLAHVQTAGYRWFAARELGVKRGGPFLAAAGAGEVVRRPLESPALFRAFADLDAGDLDALAAFASEHGPLGCPSRLTGVRPGRAAGLYFPLPSVRH